MLAGELTDRASRRRHRDGQGPADNDNPTTIARYGSIGADGYPPASLEGCRRCAQQGGALTTKKEDRTYLLFLQRRAGRAPKALRTGRTLFPPGARCRPINAMALNYLGYMLADKGVSSRSAEVIRKAVEHGADERRLSRLARLGLLQDGPIRAGRRNLRQAVERTRPIPRSTSISAIFTRRPAVSDLPQRSGSYP